ncbi:MULTISPECIES: ComEA family DNA-binding protein [Fusobacterium]|jgi:competence protein ComEA|uniref:ComEA family DNA-binding protein n=2 Tax=Fusobacteriaceae TaxID=203492 RepID=UPI0008A214C1|nr:MULTISPECIES: helix-hairpin-helix domain-containing protein [Fusobacterium]MCF0170923.1 helix-hairpin-helix domain-containing protein [Fusobacterium varium]MCF2671907.1 helix-hairpin-helix domain-containing protein [Fusobacterium varium]MCI6031443.1 helix-hairpin-helix domain-containing protein [Fusobacterium varium]MDY4005605.1 helix-hairpin-helix domain-containing protein [Fusobacterium varium]OFL83375.1 competence protein [Fusobacterium sp. HMSC073F01]
MKICKEMLIAVMLAIISSFTFGEEDVKPFKLIISENMLEKKDNLIEINTASKEDMVSQGIGIGYANKIFNYREKTGGFEKLEELKRIKGIGDATYEKLSKKFKIENEVEKNPLYINEANDELLKYFGFDKKEIKKIREYINKNNRIDNNLQLMEILSKKRYEKYKKIIKYDKF